MSPEQILNNLVSSGKTPGVHYIHFNEEKIIYEFLEGSANIRERVKVSHRTVFHACSVTKTFTALAIMQLQQRNELNIENPIKYYWPEFPYPGNITIQHLLSHTAGIPNPIPLNWIHL